jgi:hypothetical protein
MRTAYFKREQMILPWSTDNVMKQSYQSMSYTTPWPPAPFLMSTPNEGVSCLHSWTPPGRQHLVIDSKYSLSQSLARLWSVCYDLAVCRKGCSDCKTWLCWRRRKRFVNLRRADTLLCSMTFCVCKIVKSDYLLRRVCLSVSPHGTTRLPLDGFWWNLMFELFPEICRQNSSFIKIRQE